MANLVVLKFPEADGAYRMLNKLEDLQKQELIHIEDAAVVTWEQDKKKPKTRHLSNLAGMGALDGAFWGLLFGLLFSMPLLGMAMGAGLGALSGSFADMGIDEDFIDQVREKVTEGTSALFLLECGAVVDRIHDEVKGMDFELIASNLPQDQEEKLRETFAA
jgi:uncharacterized membrane protein